jgi:hypothetical protein
MIDAGLIPNHLADEAAEGEDKKQTGSVIARKRKVKKSKDEGKEEVGDE